MSYVSSIANSIISHSHGAVILGPDVYTAIAEWEKRGIPAVVVMESIEEVFGEKSNCGDEIMPVEIFSEAVSRNFRVWLAKEVRV